MLPLQDESDEAYRCAIKEDAYLFRQRRKGRVSTELTALAYPFGYYSQETDDLLAEEGILQPAVYGQFPFPADVRPL